MGEDTDHTRLKQALTEQARQHRARPTGAEARLWQELRGRRLDGFKFRRQHPIDRFIVDFCCLERSLIVEVDGSVHLHQAERDAERTIVLEAFGYQVLRCTNDQIDQDLVVVLHRIRTALGERAPSTDTST